MGLMQEGLRRSGEIRSAFAPLNPNSSEIKVSKFPARSDRSESRVAELLGLVLGEKDKKDKAGHAEEPKLKRQDGFEPFINGSENDKNNLFVNLYGGDFSQKMELNRKVVERILKIAYLDGQVFLTTLSPNRQRSSEAQGDTLVVKRFRFFGEKTQKVEEENPYKRVVSVPEGWRIEINNTRITEELTEKKIGGKELQRAFINRFNSQFKGALKECVWREKLSSVKDKNYRSRLFWSVTYGVIPSTGLILSKFSYSNISLTWPIMGPFILYGLYNVLIIALGIPDGSHSRKKIDHPLEIFMPFIEADKVARAFAFLSIKGRKLVREAV